MYLNSKYFLFFLPFLASCTGLNVEYRDNGIMSGSDICNLDVESRMVSLEDEYLVTHPLVKSGNDLEARKLECSRQRVRMEGFDTGGLSGSEASIYNTYDLNFLEFGSTDGRMLDLKQLRDLLEQIRGDENTYVVAYVHGWRHNADVANNDVRKFKTLLAYSRQFLNQRVRENGRYKRHRLIGLFIGWRGQVFDEREGKRGEDPSTLDTAGALATVLVSENTSVKVAPHVFDALKQISVALDLGNGFNHDKFLIYGHSFGGNVLSTALSDCADSTIENPRCYQDTVRGHAAGTEMRSLLGDLVVLINPAAAAWKWTDIQRSVDQQQTRGKRIFSKFQKPIYMAFTATANWGDAEVRPQNEPKAKKLYPDNATRILYPASRVVLGKFNPDERIAIGHLAPKSQVDHLGSSHDFITNTGSPKETSSTAALERLASKCDVNDGWLARTKAKSIDNKSWDSGYPKEKGPRPEAYASIKPDVNYQFRSEQYFAATSDMNGKKKYGNGNRRFSFEPYFDIPFWNVRAFESVINFHGSYVNYPFWCAVNQIVLDDITKQ